MWIRSQDKMHLFDTKELEVTKSTVFGFSALRDKGFAVLGNYDTEERAIEVLDEMQKHLVSGSRYDTLRDHRRDIHEKVFNMPQK